MRVGILISWLKSNKIRNPLSFFLWGEFAFLVKSARIVLSKFCSIPLKEKLKPSKTSSMGWSGLDTQPIISLHLLRLIIYAQTDSLLPFRSFFSTKVRPFLQYIITPPPSFSCPIRPYPRVARDLYFVV